MKNDAHRRCYPGSYSESSSATPTHETPISIFFTAAIPKFEAFLLLVLTSLDVGDVLSSVFQKFTYL